ncbi:hypothetical protein AAFF_G00416830 [Aldrovandia affinis]|uniref:Ig-like domain-containing protein n=1 Tax=Aldrovandia affinis TaxID=143900 RepID=A0AAD7SAH2_9TELE|nr:hypothetical protein AAFF_G00416830 [Aldrovandia affinis]
MWLGWLLRIARSFPAKKVFLINCGLCHPVLQQLLVYLLFWGMPNTASSARPQETRFYAELHKQVVLYTTDPIEDLVSEVVWKKHGDKYQTILRHDANKSDYFGGYRNRTSYYFKNNTLILDAVMEEDEGTYEVSMVYKNHSVTSLTLHLSISTPLSDPSVKMEISKSQMKLVLKCEVGNGADLSYHWLKSGQLLPQDERHSLIEKNSTLQVNNLTSVDCVNYTCVAANGLARREGHIQLSGSDIETCSVSRAASTLTVRDLLCISTAVFCASGLCVVIVCINRHSQEIRLCLRGLCSNDRAIISRRGQRTIEADITENRVYEEINEQVAPAAQEVAQLPYVYTDFIPNWYGAQSGQSVVEIEDFGYSTINPLEPQSPHVS